MESNAIGRMDAIIHNASLYTERSRSPTPEGLAITLPINTLAADGVDRSSKSSGPIAVPVSTSAVVNPCSLATSHNSLVAYIGCRRSGDHVVEAIPLS